MFPRSVDGAVVLPPVVWDQDRSRFVILRQHDVLMAEVSIVDQAPQLSACVTGSNDLIFRHVHRLPRYHGVHYVHAASVFVPR